MKKIILLGITLVSVITLNAQSKLTVGVSVGAALPMGAYGSTDTAGGKTAVALRGNSKDSTEANGYAKTGFHFDVTAGYLFSDNIGGMVYIGGNMNSFDISTLETQNKVTSPATASSTNYYVGQYLVGPYLSLGGSKLKIDIRVLVGLVTCNTTTITYNNGASGAFAGSSTSSGNGGSGFGYQVGAGIKYNFTDKMGLLVNVGYTGSSVAYTGYTQVSDFGNNSQTYTNTTLKSTMALSILTTTVGIAFNL
jgi:hypothetical protein